MLDFEQESDFILIIQGGYDSAVLLKSLKNLSNLINVQYSSSRGMSLINGVLFIDVFFGV